MWTRFMDMCSGGSYKLDASDIWIEAPYYDAIELFEAIFERDPDNITCPCCGPDYSIDECEPEIKDGDIVINAEDIKRFRGGLKLEAQ